MTDTPGPYVIARQPPPAPDGRLCTCEVHCVLHGYADDMLRMLYRYASECAHCEGSGEVIVSSVQRDVDWWDETMGPCGTCADIHELIKRVDPTGDRLQREQSVKAASEPEDDVAF